MNEMPCSQYNECKQVAITTCNICDRAFCQAHTLRVTTEVPDLDPSEEKLAGKPISWYAVTLNKGVKSYAIVQRYCLDCYEEWLRHRVREQSWGKAYVEKRQQALDFRRQNVRFIHLNGRDELPEYRHIPLQKAVVLQEQLNKIPWSHLTHCYGPAKDMPFHLLGLLSKKKRERELAWYHMYSAICHQGSIYEASCAIIPFLIQILEQVTEKQQLEILNLFDGLALCECHAERKLRLLQVEHFSDVNNDHYQWFSWGEFLQVGNSTQDPQWIALAHRLVGDNMPTFLMLLQNAERPVKIKVLFLL